MKAAGLPLELESGALLERSLALQEQLSAAEEALVVEGGRADSAVKEAEQARNAWQCRVCLANEVAAVLAPCGHVLCEPCATAVQRCPFCRSAVSRASKMFRP